MKVGILALQGSFKEHGDVLERIGASFLWIRSKEDLKGLTHLIIPGGESTTLRKLLKAYEMWQEIISQVQDGTLKVFGTCAGAILLEDFGMDIKVDRNAYGAQQDSFQDVLDSDIFKNVEGVFIRAPKIIKKGKKVAVLARYKKEPVLVQERNLLAASFHPELTDDTSVHEYFLND
ncbi:UNVERIFIED_CONTAM: hypothetical protein GTU68_016303 [Idotea baltica]|nr:hypothetical protein [Idotea baltica]